MIYLKYAKLKMQLLKRAFQDCSDRGQFFLKKMLSRYLFKKKLDKLSIGCGGKTMSGWMNTDYSPSRLLGSDPVYFLDATQRFPFGDSSLRFIYSEHMFEHIPLEAGRKMLRECFRTLKPGGILRTATPNLQCLIDLYQISKTDQQQRYIQRSIDVFSDTKIYFDTLVINQFFKLWGHQFIYDFKTLKYILEWEGFSDIKLCEVGKSSHPELCDIEKHGLSITDEFNRLETMCVEAKKA